MNLRTCKFLYLLAMAAIVCADIIHSKDKRNLLQNGIHSLKLE